MAVVLAGELVEELSAGDFVEGLVVGEGVTGEP
jgi:hypothetical protein